MSSSSSQRPPAPRTYPQDYIARIRYNNALPVPIGPPKLLDIPNSAFSQYTDTSFVSQLARSEALNIEVDSELGMPLDLVHIPRVFEGDDSVLRPMDPIPPVDPRDRALLRAAASLGKPTNRTASGGSSVSFLRRTEYISSEQSRSSFKSTTSGQLVAIQSSKARRTAHRPEDTDPVRILAAVMKGFDVANPNPDVPDAARQYASGDKAAMNAERNWKEMKHPNKPGVKALETFPLLPHLEGMSDTGGYMVFKFQSAPTDESRDGHRDVRVDMSLFQPVEIHHDEEIPPEERKECFDCYIPDTPTTAGAVKRKFEYGDELNDDEFRYTYVRRYEAKDTRGGHTQFDQQPEEIAMCLQSGDGDGPRGAFFYPILGRYTIRPKRKTKFPFDLSQQLEEEEQEPAAEALRLKIRDLMPSEKRRREEYIARYEGVELPSSMEKAGGEEHDDDEDAPGEEE